MPIRFIMALGLSATCILAAWGAASPTRPAPAQSAFDGERIPEFKADYSLAPDTLTIYGSGEKIRAENSIAKLPGDKECAWILEGIEPGNYYLGLFLANPGLFTGTDACQYALFHNGNRILFTECTAPVKIGREYFSEMISEKSVRLAHGDELRLNNLTMSGKRVGPLNLYLKRPGQGILSVSKGLLNDAFDDDFFRPSVKLEEPAGFHQKARGQISVFNALPVAQTLNIELKVADYFTTPVLEFKATASIAPRGKYEKNFEYPWGASDRYMATLTVSDGKGNTKESWRQILTPSKTDFRSKEWINQDWEVKPVKGTNFVNIAQAQGGQWASISLPFNAETKFKEEHVFWYKKQFVIPEWMQACERFFITFTGLGYDAEIFVNGKKIHYCFDPHSPCKIEITSDLRKNARNEILIGARDNIAALAPEELRRNPAQLTRHASYATTIAPDGNSGIDETYLEGVPKTYIEDARVTASYRRGELGVLYDISNPERAKYIVETSVYFKGAKVFTFDKKNLGPVAEENRAAFSVEGKWAQPVLWSCWAPNLLCLKTELKTEDGKTLDIKHTRFGFREVWCEGIKLLINGTRIKMGAIAMSDFSSRANYRDYIKLGKRTELTGKVHMYTGPMLQDINDEEGILAFLRTPELDGVTGQKNECDQYWENAEKWALASVKAYWNHPSIIAWELSNEWARYDRLALRRLQNLGASVKKLDASRLVSFSCDLDINGWNDHISTHYPVDCRGVRDNAAYLPDSALWYPAGTELEKGMKIPCGQIKSVANIPEKSPILWGNKPIFISESGWKLQYFPPNGFASVLGDWPYRGVNEAGEAHILLNRWFLSRHRDVEPALITPWHWCWSDPFTRIIPQIDIVPLESYSRWFGGETVAFRVNLHYDKPEATKLKFTCKITDELTETVLFQKCEDLEFQPAELKRHKIKIALPEAGADRKASLTFTLEDKSGKILCERIVPSKIFASKRRIPSGRGIVLFDPAGDTATLLETAGIRFKYAANLSPDILRGKKILVVGRDAAQNKIVADNADAIENFVVSGGSVLIMNQSAVKIKWTPVPLVPIADKKTSICFRRAPNHPVLNGLEDEDVKFWYPDHLLSSADYRKPLKGNFIPILDAATGPDGMEFCQVIEIPWGQGCYLASQIEFNQGKAWPPANKKDDVSWLGRIVAAIFRPGQANDKSNYGKNPLAQKLLANIIAHLENYRRTEPALGCILKPGGQTENKLASIGLVYRKANAENMSAFAVVFVEMDALDAKTAKPLKKFVQAGGTAILHKVTLKNKNLANEICDNRLLLYKDYPPAFKGRLLKISAGAIIAGLGNADFFWKTLPIDQAYEATYSSPDWAKESILENPIAIIDGETYTYPGAIGKLQIGKGSVFVDQINWDTPNTSVIKESNRIPSVMFSNLGCTMRKTRIPDIPENLEFTPLDISKYLNRSLVDEVDNDGAGGWSDQGPQMDFRELKPGLKKYNGVPFMIAKDKSCLVLRSERRKPTVPLEVAGIAVNKKAEVVYFLQSSAYTTGVMAKYIIRYKGGKTFAVELSDGVNMRDWGSDSPDKPFYNETITRTQRAFTYTAPAWPKKRSIYMTAWLNPDPGLEIESFDFISMDNGVPILLAATLGNEPKTSAAVKATPGDRAKAIKYYEAAGKAFKDGATETAVKLLRASIEADNTLADAHARLGRHYRDADKPQEAEKEFRMALATDARALDVYLMLGEILEKQKRFSEALALYEKSFAVDVNQPRITEAMRKMHERLDAK